MPEKLTPRAEDFSAWYNEVVLRAQLADYSSVKGCMVIRPYGYGLWEMIQSTLDAMIKETGAENAYFPLFIPESFLKREAEHVEGFAPEVAVVTHAGGKKLEEPLVIRPTSETAMYDMFSKWIMSWRDLPLMVNQWANVVRWELRTRLFLRTTEFLWQEGHTAHATYDEAQEETLRMLEVYRRFAEEVLAIPVVAGLKTDAEKFAGALATYGIEAMMQDGKALQAGTSHNLGQNFAKVFDVKYQTPDNEWEYVWQTSWGVSTRLVGAVVMAHGDDAGLILPPRIAPHQVVVVPIWRDDDGKAKVTTALSTIRDSLKAAGVRFRIDDREQYNPGYKFNEWELRGVPLRVEIGPRDVAADQCVVVSRVDGEKRSMPLGELAARLPELLESVQSQVYDRALKLRTSRTRRVDTYEEFTEALDGDGGFVEAHWDGTAETEAKIKDETKATIRVVPLDGDPERGRCILTGEPSERRVLFARAY
jgi:prolyl-tRNA synthetase